MPSLLLESITPRNSFSYYSVDERHQVRVWLRHFRLSCRLLRHSKIGERRLGETRLIEKMAKELLSDYGVLRDLDICMETLQKINPDNHRARNRIMQELKRALVRFRRQWPLTRRRWIMDEINKYLDRNFNGVVIEKKMLKKEFKNRIVQLTKHKPRSKPQWHRFRRTLRRASFLLEMLDKKNRFITQFQKRLGRLHDLEVLGRKIGHTKIVKAAAADLELEIAKDFGKLRRRKPSEFFG